MGVVYQLTFFLALALLAIVITIFVFAVSLLGRAMEAAARSEHEKVLERKESNVKEMATIREEIEEAEASGQIPKGLTRNLEKLEKKDKKFEKELSKIRKAPELLTVKGGVLPSSAPLLGALILTGAAWYLSNLQIFTWIVPVLIWILGIVATGYSIFRIYQSLNVIEGVAITSEEAALLRETEALKRTFRELEEDKKPKLALIFQDKKPPFHIGTDEELTIKFTLDCTQGDVARKPEVYLAAPPGFEFPDSPKRLPPLHEGYTSYVCAGIEFADITKGMYRLREVKIKAPSQPKRYTVLYRLYCEGFDSGYDKFEVVVE